MTAARLAVVSGTAGAIGGAIAEVLAADGWQVIGVDRRPAADALPLVDEIVGDVSLGSTWQAVAGRLISVKSGLHGLVHSAAMQLCSSLQETEETDWDRLIATNLKAVYLAGRALHASLVAAKGAVVGIGSVHAHATSNNIATYAASKGGMSALMRALAIEWAPDGIRVNTVLPGAVDSVMLRESLTRDHLNYGDVEDRLQQLSARTVIGRIGAPTEIAQMVKFLLDPASSSFVTGAEFVVDGGALARLSTE